jgi:LmbE family N-acetylglucosaminyl deacetylase
MVVVEPPEVESLVAIAAHPDDIESWCAGTLALAIDKGAVVRLLLVTSGEHGTTDPMAEPQAVAARREAEARVAAHTLGIVDVEFLRYPDGDVELTRALRGDLVKWIRRWRPAVLFTHDCEHPWPTYLSHRDHRIVGRAALDAVYPLARDPLAFADHMRAGLHPHAVREVWLFASDIADAYVDISIGFERKIAARLAHASQTDDPEALRENWQRRAADVGRIAQLPLAETFTVLRLD